jgi:hypothetical protein
MDESFWIPGHLKIKPPNGPQGNTPRGWYSGASVPEGLRNLPELIFQTGFCLLYREAAILLRRKQLAAGE